MGTEVQSCSMERILEMDCITMQMYFTTLYI